MTFAAPTALSDAQQLALQALRDSEAPLTAYEVLGSLRKAHPKAAPPTAYRALNRLIALGLAHRLESLNAYVACDHPHHSEQPIFTICDACGWVNERNDADMNRKLYDTSAALGFAVGSIIVEIHGLCSNCAAQGRSA